MPKNPKRNIQNYQIEGADLNEFEFQKNQSEMAEESDPPFTHGTDGRNQRREERAAEEPEPLRKNTSQ